MNPADPRIQRLRRMAWLLDGAIRIPGTRFRLGLNSVIGLVPVGGDALLTALSLYIVWEARRLGVPPALWGRMLANVAAEAGMGLVPGLGDIMDVVFKANLRNVAILDEALKMAPRAR